MPKLFVMRMGLLCLLGACTAEAGTGRRGNAALDQDGATGQACAATNLTQGCTCNGAPGRQVCSAAGAWGACECLDPGGGAAGGAGGGGGGNTGGPFTDPPANKLAASFLWLRTPVGAPSSDCLPGHYEGSFDGGYQAPLAFNTPIPVFSQDISGKPGLRFDLMAGGSGEFLEVKDGKMDGVADGLFPFTADIVGQLDCASGQFRARLENGQYIVGVIPYQFAGDFVARYDPATRSFVDGRWAVMEGGATPPPVDPSQPPPTIPAGQSGGAGTWTTMWTH